MTQETKAYQATSHPVCSQGSTCQHPWCSCITCQHPWCSCIKHACAQHTATNSIQLPKCPLFVVTLNNVTKRTMPKTVNNHSRNQTKNILWSYTKVNLFIAATPVLTANQLFKISAGSTENVQ